MTPLRIAITDDHRLFVDGILFLLKERKDMEVVETFHSSEQLLEFLDTKLASNPIDLITLDINMQGADGVTAAQAIKRDHPEIKLLIISQHYHISYIKKLMRIGVDGYILKDGGQEEFFKALDSIKEGEKHFAEVVQQTLMDNMHGSYSPSGLDRLSLSRREHEVLQWVAKGHTTPDIAERLFVAPSTVMTHRKNIMQKLDVKNVAEMIRVATENGLLD